MMGLIGAFELVSSIKVGHDWSMVFVPRRLTEALIGCGQSYGNLFPIHLPRAGGGGFQAKNFRHSANSAEQRAPRRGDPSSPGSWRCQPTR
jgi:hypothetical protein